MSSCAATIAPDYLPALAELLGPACVSVDEPVLAVHSTDKWFASARTDVVVFVPRVLGGALGESDLFAHEGTKCVRRI